MKKVLERFVRLILDLLFPPRCVFCGEIVPPGKQVCRECAEKAVPSRKILRWSLLHGGKRIPCAALYPYQGRVRDSILRYKFHGQKQNAGYYAEKLSGLVRLAFPDAGFSLVTWVPLSAGRKRERGYDQAELIAEKLAKTMCLPCVSCLRKAKANRVQHLLNREERAANVRGVYVSEGRRLSGKKILLVDDIITTGATMAECAEVLAGCGAGSVSCIAVAQSDPGCVEKSPAL